MREMFQWVDWFEELGERVSAGGREGLAERAGRVDWAGGSPAVLANGAGNADPLTFFYHLASIAGGKAAKMKTVYTSVAEIFGIERSPAFPCARGCIFPTPVAFAVQFDADPDLLWKMFEQARAVDGSSYGAASADTFAKTLQVKGVGIPKLTQVLFLINPRAFLPFDKVAVLPLGIGKWKGPPGTMTWDQYLGEMGRIRAAFPGCEHYEMNVIGYLWVSGKYPRKDRRFFQIDSSDSEWADFCDNNWVRAQGDTVAEPTPGDVVLVRAGKRQGRGIGIVYRNDSGKQPDGSGPVHVLWVNKSQGELAASMPTARFSRVGSASYDAFAQSNAYSETMRLVGPPPPPPDTPLNLILYGPPGTGKTWHAATRAVAIGDGQKVSEVEQEDRVAVKRRYKEHRADGRIEMVTFHQNTTYEDFVEGIRPVLAEADAAAGDVQYEMSQGVFRRIAERAEADPDAHYVLVIDEINRGNIARIFGELITLLEDSKRIGAEDEAFVTLPGSKAEFGVPANLHVLGTMNTADRSIALLDTALRRRFVFEEMMPDPSHHLIATDVEGIDCRELLKAMNRRITALLNREHQIGHTYLLGIDTVPKLAATFRNRIVPLLQEYFYDDWEKIRAVLNNNGFVTKGNPPKELVTLNLVNDDQGVYDLLPADDNRWTDATAYQKIYGKAGKASQDGGEAQSGE